MRTITATTGHHRSVDDRLDHWLVPEGRELTTNLGKAMERAPELRTHAASGRSRLNHAARMLLAGMVVDQLRQGLPQRLSDMLLQGMRLHEALVAAAERTLRDPTADGQVGLFRRTLQARHAVDVDVVMTPLTVTLPFVLTIDFDVAGATGMVRDGRLCELSLDDPAMLGRVVVYQGEVYEKKLHEQKGVLRIGGALPPFEPVRILSAERELLLRRPAT